MFNAVKKNVQCSEEKCSVTCSFSRHAKAQTSLALVIWLNENVQRIGNNINLTCKDTPNFQKNQKKAQKKTFPPLFFLIYALKALKYERLIRVNPKILTNAYIRFG